MAHGKLSHGVKGGLQKIKSTKYLKHLPIEITSFKI